MGILALPESSERPLKTRRKLATIAISDAIIVSPGKGGRGRIRSIVDGHSFRSSESHHHILPGMLALLPGTRKAVSRFVVIRRTYLLSTYVVVGSKPAARTVEPSGVGKMDAGLVNWPKVRA